MSIWNYCAIFQMIIIPRLRLLLQNFQNGCMCAELQPVKEHLQKKNKHKIKTNKEYNQTLSIIHLFWRSFTQYHTHQTPTRTYSHSSHDHLFILMIMIMIKCFFSCLSPFPFDFYPCRFWFFLSFSVVPLSPLLCFHSADLSVSYVSPPHPLIPHQPFNVHTIDSQRTLVKHFDCFCYAFFSVFEIFLLLLSGCVENDFVFPLCFYPFLPSSVCISLSLPNDITYESQRILRQSIKHHSRSSTSVHFVPCGNSKIQKDDRQSKCT